MISPHQRRVLAPQEIYGRGANLLDSAVAVQTLAEVDDKICLCMLRRPESYTFHIQESAARGWGTRRDENAGRYGDLVSACIAATPMGYCDMTVRPWKLITSSSNLWSDCRILGFRRIS